MKINEYFFALCIVSKLFFYNFFKKKISTREEMKIREEISIFLFEEGEKLETFSKTFTIEAFLCTLVFYHFDALSKTLISTRLITEIRLAGTYTKSKSHKFYQTYMNNQFCQNVYH